jgi:glyoxylase-like metal-dependent hydrolase (beta-lactamase superfamily II)
MVHGRWSAWTLGLCLASVATTNSTAATEVLFAGCFLKSNDAIDLGFTGAADLQAWPASIRRLRDKYGRLTIVPGHGPVDREGASYQHTLDLLGAAAK